MTDEEMKAMLGNMSPAPEPNIGVLIPIGKAAESEEVTEDSLRVKIAAAITVMHDCLGDRMESDLPLSDKYWELRNRVHILQGQLKTRLNIAGNPYNKGPE